MKNFNVKQSGSEAILEEVNPYREFNVREGRYEDNKLHYSFTPLILTSIDPNIKVGDLIREDQLEVRHQWYSKGENHWYPGKQTEEEDIADGYLTRQVAKLKQPAHETPKSGYDLETCTEKDINKVEEIIVDWLKSGNENATYLAHLILQELTGEAIQEENCHYPDSVQYAIGLFDFIKHEIDYLPEDIYDRINNVVHRLECEFDGFKVPEHKPESEETVAKSLTVYKKEVQDRMKRMEMQPEYINGHSQGFADCFNFLVMNGFEITKKK